jgi:enoyl-CoA hydratase/carnithine racemase
MQKAEAKLIEVNLVGAACVIRFRRESKLNAFSTGLESELLEALASPAVRDSACLIFTGGDRVFSSGADVSEMRSNTPAEIFASYQATGELYERVASLPKPVISAISGYCLGGGFELALATDFRLADETAVFGLPEVAIGIVPSSGGTYRLVRAIGAAKAKEIILLGRRLSATEALDLGLVVEVCPPGRALPRALELAEELAALPPLALAVAKTAVDTIGSNRDVAILIERLAYGMLAQTADAHEAADAFTEKRKPTFGRR